MAYGSRSGNRLRWKSEEYSDKNLRCSIKSFMLPLRIILADVERCDMVKFVF